MKRLLLILTIVTIISAGTTKTMLTNIDNEIYTIQTISVNQHDTTYISQPDTITQVQAIEVIEAHIHHNTINRLILN